MFLFSNLKTSRYDTVASQYQKEMDEYQQKFLLKGDNENRAYISQRRELATVLIEKKENKPWTQRSVKTYLGRVNMEAAVKTLPFFVKAEEKKELTALQKEQKEIQENVRKLRKQQGTESESGEKKRAEADAQIREYRKTAVENLAKENLLEAILIRKEAAEKLFLRKINYAYDFQKQDIESYYREKRKELENTVESTGAEDDRPEDEER